MKEITLTNEMMDSLFAEYEKNTYNNKLLAKYEHGMITWKEVQKMWKR